MSATRDLFAGVTGILTAASVATASTSAVYTAGQTGIAQKRMPPEPDRVVVLGTYGVTDDNPPTASGIIGLQFMMRGLADDPLDVDDLADEIYQLFQGLTGVQFGSVHVASCLRNSWVPHGQDDSRRSLRSDSYYFRVDYPATAYRPD